MRVTAKILLRTCLGSFYKLYEGSGDARYIFFVWDSFSVIGRWFTHSGVVPLFLVKKILCFVIANREHDNRQLHHICPIQNKTAELYCKIGMLSFKNVFMVYDAIG